MIATKLKALWPFFGFLIIIFAFLHKLFFPLSIITTPDFGRSDSWHFSVANKYYYAQELKKNRLPLWNSQIGTGFPTFAEGQSGVLFLPNLFLFRLFPFVYAYNLSLIFALFTTATGTYLFLKSLKLSKEAAFFAGIVFSLNGFFLVHLQHHNLLQTTSVIPFLFWQTQEFLTKKRVIHLVLFSIFLSQAVFAGFPQLVFYSLVILIVYFLTTIYFFKENRIKAFIAYFFFVSLGLLTSSVQIIPTYELLNHSQLTKVARLNVEEFLYTPLNLLQFFDPFVLGSPKEATYPRWIPGKWGIFWESIAYTGILPLSFSIAVLFSATFKKVKRRKILITFIIMILISLSLALGKFSPLHPILSFPIFSSFRVPSRFLYFVAFMVVVSSAFFVEKLTRKKIILLLVITASIFDLASKFYSYNSFGDADSWFKKPKLAQSIDSGLPKRIYSFGMLTPWNKSLFEKGWQGNNGYYFFARNSLDQNSNLIFGYDQFLSYESMQTSRSSINRLVIEKGLSLKNDILEISEASAKFLSSSEVGYIITPYKITSTDFSQIGESESYEGVTFYVYKNNLNPQRIILTRNVKYAQTIGEIIESVTKDFDPTKEAILEEKINLDDGELSSWTADITSKTPTKIVIEVSTSTTALLVISDSYYPGWTAYLDGKKSKVYPATINKKATVIPQGKHEIIFKFEPKSFYLGSIISLTSFLALLGIYLTKRKKTI